MSEPYWSALGAAAVDYEGVWAAGTPYAPGDVVLHNGALYLAVNPSLGSAPPAVAAPFPAVPVLPVTVDGDGYSLDGIFNWLGTDGYRSAFMNPADAGFSTQSGYITVLHKRGDGLAGRYHATQDSNLDVNRTADKATDHLIDDINTCTHTAGGTPCWWKADFGVNRRFLITRLSFWSRPNINTHTSWKYQGSNDDSAWTDLANCSGYPTDWQQPHVTPIVTAVPYRFIRWFNPAGGYITIGDLEMWGTLSAV